MIFEGFNYHLKVSIKKARYQLDVRYYQGRTRRCKCRVNSSGGSKGVARGEGVWVSEKLDPPPEFKQKCTQVTVAVLVSVRRHQ